MLASSLFSLLLLSTSAFGLSDRKAHELSRSRARAHYGKREKFTFEVNANTTSDNTIEKRGQQYANSRATFYDVGLGACGWYNSANDYIVAQNSAQYGGGYPGPNCGRSITISYGGKQVTATIADECPTCPYGGLDMSRGLFTQFASEGAGVFYMTWWYNDESQEATTTSEKPKTTATSTYTPPTSTYVEPSTTPTPTSTYVEPSTSSSPTPTPTSTVESSTSSSVVASASTTSFLPSASSSGLADTVLQTNATLPAIANATSTISSEDSETTAPVAALGNLVLFNQAVAYLGHLVVVGAEN
ncbi:uncharacterized protein IL334_004058 [Kwoniella shivajii]|uniref:B2-aldehyde-forming enzyme n=1 Tax=Kwoniella shivajii TaxID=564305 RepID=A0ABZ1D3B9_9TREE|nr:hypothetical protein IL334_004058 [Kwoniella shivajii]